MSPPLESLSDSALSEAVAIEVAGWKGPFQSEWLREHGMEGEDLFAYCGTNPQGERDVCPNFATSADAVLPLLEKHGALFRPELVEVYPSIEGRAPTHWHITLLIPPEPKSAFSFSHNVIGTAPTFPRATCFALLKAARANKK